MRDWLKQEPIVIARGRGAVLEDVHGKRYLDANSSIWTNLHGHNHPRINSALRKQLSRIAHSSALGLANEPAAKLAATLVAAVNDPFDKGTGRGPASARNQRANNLPQPRLEKVFFSDNGSTALEVALKLAFEVARRTGLSKNPRFVSLQGAYHGDTVGAMSLGHIDLFHRAYSPLLFQTDQVMAPYCYRCPFNRARPQRADARLYRKCHWECVDQVEKEFAHRRRKAGPYAAFVFEPLVQGAAGMIPQPAGWLRRVCEIARGHGTLLIADEVMTGFGRTGEANKDLVQGAASRRRSAKPNEWPRLFACHQEGVQPDFLALAKGLTGGYLPMAATLTTQKVFDAFLGDYGEFKTFFHGHSFTGNQLGATAALTSLELLRTGRVTKARQQLEDTFERMLQQLWRHPQVGDIRRVGLIAGIELVKDWRTRQPFEPTERAGIRVCEAMARRGVLTRPIGNVIVLMPPYCTTSRQVRQMVDVLSESIREVFPLGP